MNPLLDNDLTHVSLPLRYHRSGEKSIGQEVVVWWTG